MKPSHKVLLVVGPAIVFAAIAIALLVTAVIMGLAWIDRMPLDVATPPEVMKTLRDFQDWKGEEIIGTTRYTDRSTGRVYQVLLAPSGRNLGSGPSAYLFDGDGKFIEWTPDMGDIFTSINGYDLSSGNLERTD